MDPAALPFRSKLNRPPSDTAGLACDPDESHTKQEFKSDCDINRIMSKYTRTGVAPRATGSPVYGDFSSDLDFQEAQNRLLQAEAEFRALPSKVRDRFRNNPAQLLAFLADPKNLNEARDLGLVDPLPPPPPPAAPVTPGPVTVTTLHTEPAK